MGDEITWTDRTTINDSGYEVQMAVDQVGVYRHRVKVDFALVEGSGDDARVFATGQVGLGPWIFGLPPQLVEGCGGEGKDGETVNTEKYEIIVCRNRLGGYRHRVWGEPMWNEGLPPAEITG